MLKDKDGTTGLENIGRKYLRHIHRNLPTGNLYQEIIRNREGLIAHLGPVVTRTGHFNEQGPEDRFVIKGGETSGTLLKGFNTITETQFNNMFMRAISFMQTREAYVQTMYAGMDPDNRMSFRIITETAWHNLVVRNLFNHIHEPGQGKDFNPDFTIIIAPGLISIPENDGTRSSSFVIAHMGLKLMFIGGTSYAGEIRNAIFTVMGNMLFNKGVFSFRGSSNVGYDGDVAVFMGRKGTGKTSLAMDPDRKFLGDHGHGWTEKGLFAFGKGGYAKIMDCKKEDEPEIFSLTQNFGSVLENVAIDPDTTAIDLSDRILTENTRVIFPKEALPLYEETGMAGHPKHIFLLTKDAFGVLPPIAKLSPEQAICAFLSSYTSIFSETFDGASNPKPKFSTCFGGCPMDCEPHDYALSFLDKIQKHEVSCWIMNTGWIGEAHGKVERTPIAYSRALARAAMNGVFENVEFEVDPVFGYEIPLSCPGVPSSILNPRNMAEDQGEYEVRANRLAEEFMNKFEQYGSKMPENIRGMLTSVLIREDILAVTDIGFGM